MDAYAFVREADAPGLDELRNLVGTQPGIVSFLPTVGAYRAFVKIASDEPRVVHDALSAVSGIETLIGIETMLGTSPSEGTEKLDFADAVTDRADHERLATLAVDAGRISLALPPPPRMPTSGIVREVVGLQVLVCDPGYAVEVYAQVAAAPGVVGAAVLAHLAPAVLVEFTGADEHALVVAAEVTAAARGVADAALSIGFAVDSVGLRTE